MKSICRIVSALALLGIGSAAYAQRRGPQLDFTPLDSLVTSWMERDYYPGGAVAIGRDSDILFSKCYGDFTEETPVYVASAGKWVAAAVVAALWTLAIFI